MNNRLRGAFYQNLKNPVYHTLKGFPGWSALNLQKIDLTRLVDMSYCKRSFMIMDRDLPYTLYIRYENPKTPYLIVPMIGSVFVETISKRYKTEDDVKSEILEILEITDKKV